MNFDLVYKLDDMPLPEQIRRVNWGRWPATVTAFYFAFTPIVFLFCFYLILVPSLLNKKVIFRRFLSFSAFRPFAKIQMSIYSISMLVAYWIAFSEYQLP